MTAVIDRPNTAGPRLGERTAQFYVETALANLAALRTSTEWGWLEVNRPTPTAAFSRRDTLSPGYPMAAEVARRHGFEPIIRPAGGRLVAYHDGAIIIDVFARHPSPASEIDRRFAAFGDTLAAALRTLGVDARVGPVAGEYCPGRFSVNVAGRAKLAGTAQRLTSGSFLLTAVLLVVGAEPIRAVLTESYPHLGVPWNPASVACVSDYVGAVTKDGLQAVLLDALADLLPLRLEEPEARADVLRVPLRACWHVER